MSDLLLGLDFGTGGAKAAIVDAEGAVRGYAFEEYPTHTPRPGWSEHEPRRYWDATCRLIRQALVEAKASGRDVKGVAVSSALPSMVMVDGSGAPVNNAYNLMDRRATAEVQWLKDTIGEDTVFEITKNRLDDHPSIVNLLWERANRPESFSRVRKALTIDGYVTWLLTGVYVSHYSAAPFNGVAWDLLKRRFDEKVLERIGIAPDLFPEYRSCEEIVGAVTAGAAAATGLAPGTPVAAGQVDCNAGWMGAGALDDGDTHMNLGTCGNFGVIHRQPVFHRSMIAFTYTTDSRNRFITVPTTTTGGGLIRYLRDRFYLAEKEREASGGPDTYELINQEAQATAPGAEGLIVLPYLMGERTPIWDVHARGVLFGLSLNHGRGHVARAMMEAVAYALYDSFRLIRETGQAVNPPLVLNEGGAKSALWRRIITDVFGVPTVLVKSRAGAPFGDAILAGVATGVFKDYTVARQWAEYVDPMEPNAAAHARYAEYFELYKNLYRHVREDFRSLAGLRTRSAIEA
jgi:xylulokinase